MACAALFAWFSLSAGIASAGYTLGKAKEPRDGGASLGESKERGWVFVPAFNTGYNYLLEGYDEYENLGHAGLDLYVQPSRDTLFPSHWIHNLWYRLSVDYFPLQVPKDSFGLEEDLYSASVNVVYQFYSLRAHRKLSLVPFAGVGIANYWDRVTLDTPATGKRSGTTTYSGLVFSAGVFLPEFKLLLPLRLIPEVRYHRLNGIDGAVTHITYQIGVSYWINGND